MVQQQNPTDPVPAPETRVADDWRVTARPRFDVAGGVDVEVRVPTEPPHRAADGPGRTATVKMWTRASDEPTPILAYGAPDAVRTEATPCALEMAGAPLPVGGARRFYAIAIRVFVDLVEVDGFSAVFDPRDGSLVRRMPA